MLSSWVIDREIFVEEATNLRARFDAERGVSNAKAIRLLKVRVFWYIYYDILKNAICCKVYYKGKKGGGR